MLGRCSWFCTLDVIFRLFIFKVSRLNMQDALQDEAKGWVLEFLFAFPQQIQIRSSSQVALLGFCARHMYGVGGGPGNSGWGEAGIPYVVCCIAVGREFRVPGRNLASIAWTSSLLQLHLLSNFPHPREQ